MLLAFLDPVCITDSSLAAQETLQASQQLGAQGRHVGLVAVNLNPLYNSIACTRAFDREEQLTRVWNRLLLQLGQPARSRPPSLLPALAVCMRIARAGLRFTRRPASKIGRPAFAVGSENQGDQALFVNDATSAVMPADPDTIQVGDAIWRPPQCRDTCILQDPPVSCA